MLKKQKPPLKDNLFYALHACQFMGISRRTMHNWLRSGKITSIRTLNGRHLFELREINRIRAGNGMAELTEEGARELWHTW